MDQISSPKLAGSAIWKGYMHELPISDILGQFLGYFYYCSSVSNSIGEKMAPKLAQKVTWKLDPKLAESIELPSWISSLLSIRSATFVKRSSNAAGGNSGEDEEVEQSPYGDYTPYGGLDMRQRRAFQRSKLARSPESRKDKQSVRVAAYSFSNNFHKNLTWGYWHFLKKQPFRPLSAFQSTALFELMEIDEGVARAGMHTYVIVCWSVSSVWCYVITSGDLSKIVK